MATSTCLSKRCLQDSARDLPVIKPLILSMEVTWCVSTQSMVMKCASCTLYHIPKIITKTRWQCPHAPGSIPNATPWASMTCIPAHPTACLSEESTTVLYERQAYAGRVFVYPEPWEPATNPLSISRSSQDPSADWQKLRKTPQLVLDGIRPTTKDLFYQTEIYDNVIYILSSPIHYLYSDVVKIFFDCFIIFLNNHKDITST